MIKIAQEKKLSRVMWQVLKGFGFQVFILLGLYLFIFILILL